MEKRIYGRRVGLYHGGRLDLEGFAMQWGHGWEGCTEGSWLRWGAGGGRWGALEELKCWRVEHVLVGQLGPLRYPAHIALPVGRELGQDRLGVHLWQDLVGSGGECFIGVEKWVRLGSAHTCSLVGRGEGRWMTRTSGGGGSEPGIDTAG
eukprot:scaffold11123_cov68-Isochrysis_galbana.AAC.2